MDLQKILLQFEPEPKNILRAIREVNRSHRYISEADCQKISRYFSMPVARVYSLASFFDLIKVKKETKRIIKVCSGGPCVMNRSLEIIRQIELLLKIELNNDSHPKVKLETMSCQGLCDRGPVMMIDDQVFEKVTPEAVDDIVLNYL